MSATTDPRIGTDLAGYRIEALLGRGGMGVVYLAHDLRLKRNVALKLISTELAADPRFRERFLQEAELAASLDHSHVVPVFGAGETDGQLWIAMRYVEGEDLATLLAREGPLERARAVQLVGQVGEALDAAHEAGLVHRDVKPANVLLTREGGAEHCYLSDFGLARSPGEKSDTASARLSGTVDYTAPELIAHEPADRRADLYSLACVLYECLAGEPPFRRPRAAATLFAHASEPPPSLHERRPDLPEAIDHVIARALAKHAAERYQTCADLREATREALGLGQQRFSRRALLIAGGTAAAAIAAAAAIPAVLLGRADRSAASPPILPLAGDSIVRVDPRTGALTNAVGVATTLGPLAVGAGSVWVGDLRRSVVSRIDPGRSAVVEEIDTSEAAPPRLLAAGEGALWFRAEEGPFQQQDVRKYDLTTRRFSGIETRDTTPGELAIAAGALWVICNPTLRIDTATGEIEATLDLQPSGASFVAVDEDTIWLAGEQREAVLAGKSRLWRIDPMTSTVAATIDLDVVVRDLAAGAGAAWVLSLDDDAVSRIDPSTSDVTTAFRVGRLPEAIAAGQGAVWVTSSRDGTVTRYDVATADLKTIDVGGAAYQAVVGHGAVWVAVQPS